MKGVKRGALVWGVLSVLVLACGTAAPGQHSEKQPLPHEGTINNPIYVRELTPEITPSQLEEAKRTAEAASKAADEKNAAEEKKRETDEALARYTKYLFYATTALAISTVGLLILGRNQMRDNKSAITAAQRSAAAAERSVTGLDRPWMIASLEPPRTDMGKGDSWNVKFKFRNVGRMPALIKGCQVNIVRLDELPAKPEYDGRGGLKGLSVTPELVLVGDECETSFVGPAPEMIPKDNREALVVYGELTYEGLDKTADHHTGIAMLVFGSEGRAYIDRERLAAYLYRD
jgi:hypothetical protein